MIKNVISVIDGAAGSCGKAKVCGEIATDNTINLGASITNCMPNAGHTYVSSDGKKFIFRNIPVASVNPKTELFIGPGSAIDMDVFIEEYKTVEGILGDRKIYVHEMVPLIEERHKEYERVHIKSGSTFKGCGAVTQEKVIRDKKLKFFKGFKNAVVCSNYEWLERLYSHLNNDSEYVMLEGSQGCDLSLNHSGNYPYVTSRNVSTSQLLADSGISAERLLQTIMVIRPFPIRISNITKSGNIIYTGDYGKGEELTWTQINIASLMGSYPFNNDVDFYSVNMNPHFIEQYYMDCDPIYLKQLFGEDYENVDLTKITPLQALELERLYNKTNGNHEYGSELICLDNGDEDLPPNWIIDKSEQTTVTKMERRIFDLDIEKLKTNCLVNTPSSLYLNFFQHLGYEYEGLKGNYEDIYFIKYLRNYLDWLESETGIVISRLGTGPRNNECIIKDKLVLQIKK